MRYTDISDSLILNYELLKIAIYEETKHLFDDRPYIKNHWKKDAFEMTDYEYRHQSPCEEMRPSFRALFYLFTQTLYCEKHITKKLIREGVGKYSETIRIILAGHFINEFPNDEIKRSLNEEKITEALDRDYIYGSMDIDFHLMRDIVTKKKEFKENETGHLATEIIDNRGKVKGLAELRPYETSIAEVTTEQQAMWLEMIGSTINSLDEMTADLFDLITYLWMVSPKSSDGYIEFHSSDALRLRNLKKRTSNGRMLDFREEDRFNIMKRVAALSSIWISLGDQKVKVLNTQEMQENELYNFKDFQRMFEIGKIRVAYDKKTGEAKGIYAVQVKPTSILTPYLVGPNRSIGLLDLKVFQYSHFTQREQKRLTRYLNLQWKIRTMKKTLQQPFKVATLLKVMDISARYNGVQIRDKFETVLDELQKDDVIKSWAYTEEIAEEKVGKKGWVKNYWSKLSIVLLPTDIVIKENQKNLLENTGNSLEDKIMSSIQQQMHHSDYERATQISDSYKPETIGHSQTAASIESIPVKMIHKEEYAQQSFQFSEADTGTEITLSPTAMQEMIQALNISIRQSASEIGISHTTLSRYIRRENKRQNKNNDLKMLNWLKEKESLINI
ncbi:hypothetical protein HMPREF3291_01640 [Bacillus sp. HMSC76G11]|nr:hypothetical protein HMPREF3291_01640 [Bacillus sp. HMSC76G11]